MDEIKNKSAKKWLAYIIIVGVIVMFTICFVISYNNIKISKNQTNTIIENTSDNKIVANDSKKLRLF